MEHFTFELILHFDPEYVGSINGLKAQVRRVCERGIEDLADVEIDLTERTYDKVTE